LVWEYTQAPEKISGPNKVTIVWTPGHHAIPENEEADKLTKEGTNKVYVDQTAGSPFAVDKDIIKCHLRHF
jgi:ribonuclease HI